MLLESIDNENTAVEADGYWDAKEPDGEEAGAATVYMIDEPEPEENSDEPVLDAAGVSRVLESLIFVSPEPLSVGKLEEVTGFEGGAIREAVNRLMEDYEIRESGIILREVAGGFSFYAKPEAADYISRLIKSQVNPRLTRAALETLAVVAYLQPVSRGVVAEIRAVHSEGVMKTLEERGLVEMVGKGGPPGYPVLYGTTEAFLEKFGLKNIDELPKLDEFSPDAETMDKIQKSLSWEILEDDAVAAGENTENTLPLGYSFEEGS